jgi:hypothetical protein
MEHSGDAVTKKWMDDAPDSPVEAAATTFS